MSQINRAFILRAGGELWVLYKDRRWHHPLKMLPHGQPGSKGLHTSLLHLLLLMKWQGLGHQQGWVQVPVLLLINNISITINVGWEDPLEKG